jgi:hypothetical protein
MFIVYAVIMGWSATINVLSLLVSEGMERWWYAVGLVQVLWTVFDIKEYNKNRHLRSENEAGVLGLFAIGSTILSVVLVILTVGTCLGGSAFIISITGEVVYTQMEQLPWDFNFIGMMALVDLAVLSLGLGLVAVIREKQFARWAMPGVVMSSIILAEMMVFFILAAVNPLTT